MAYNNCDVVVPFSTTVVIILKFKSHFCSRNLFLSSSSLWYVVMLFRLDSLGNEVSSGP